MRVLRSTSGAYIAQLGDYVIKLGDGPVGVRIGKQADWLIKHACDGLVPVLSKVGENAYVMPRLVPWNEADTARTIFTMIVDVLEEFVWSQQCDVSARTYHPTAQERVEKKIESMLPTAGVRKVMRLLAMWDEINWDALPYCLTHGDPTFINSMWHGNRLVLCDPLPSGVLPDIRALDLGKLLQSCFGYETIVDGWRYPDAPHPHWVRDLCGDDNEWRAAVMFGALHILRLLPYVGDQFREEFTRVFEEMVRLGL